MIGRQVPKYNNQSWKTIEKIMGNILIGGRKRLVGEWENLDEVTVNETTFSPLGRIKKVKKLKIGRKKLWKNQKKSIWKATNHEINEEVMSAEQNPTQN